MRSRYTAYCKKNIRYITETHDPGTRKSHDPDQAREWAESSEWLGLEIVSVEGGGADDDEGSVEFIARYKTEEGDSVEHHERGEFRRTDGRWFFVDGKVIGPEPFRRQDSKVGRNDPCPCGSGKKYKKCCGKA